MSRLIYARVDIQEPPVGESLRQDTLSPAKYWTNPGIARVDIQEPPVGESLRQDTLSPAKYWTNPGIVPT